jgi:hypothetical protein
VQTPLPLCPIRNAFVPLRKEASILKAPFGREELPGPLVGKHFM